MEDNLGLGMIPPQAMDLEEAVLGAMMLEKNVVDTVIGILESDDFYRDSHKDIYQAIKNLYQDGNPIDIKTVSHQLKKDGVFHNIADASLEVSQLTSKVSSGGNAEYHARVIREKSMKREIIRIGNVMAKDGHDDTTDPFKLIDQYSLEIERIDDVASTVVDAGETEVIRKELEYLEMIKGKRDNNETIGVPTGFRALDRKTGGFHNGNLIIVAGRPSMGKSAFMTSIQSILTVDFKIPVALFSLEMSTQENLWRIMSTQAFVPINRFFSGEFDEGDISKIADISGKKIDRNLIFIDDSASLTFTQLRSKVRLLVTRKKVRLVVIDYLQLMKGENVKGQNREQVIADISRNLKRMAKDLEVPVVALSQLSRASEARGGQKRPQLSDLRESGAIEQDADVVMLLYRPEYYGYAEVEIDGNREPSNNIGEVILAKNRNGPTGSVFLKFMPQFTRWSDRDIQDLGEVKKPEDDDDLPF